jgi:hypothetical protein
MARIQDSRNIVLSLKDYLEPLLEVDGYSFTFVADWDIGKEIVLPENYTDPDTQVSLPAGKLTVISRPPSKFIEIGGSTKESTYFISLFVRGESEGSISDLIDFFHNKLEGEHGQIGDVLIPIKDFSDTGYPSLYAPSIYTMEIEDVRSRRVMEFESANIAEKYSGNISILGSLLKSRGE